MAIFVLLLLLPLYSFRAHRTNKTIRAHNHIITVRGGRSDTGVEMGVIPHPVPLLASTFAAYHPPKSEQSSQPDKITDCITRGGTHFYTYYSWRTHSTLQKEERRQREICSVLAFFFLLHFFTQHEHTRTYAQNAFLYHTFTLPFVGLGGGGVWWWCWSSVTLMMLAYCWTWSVPKRCCCTGVRWVVRNTHSPDERF